MNLRTIEKNYGKVMRTLNGYLVDLNPRHVDSVLRRFEKTGSVHSGVFRLKRIANFIAKHFGSDYIADGFYVDDDKQKIILKFKRNGVKRMSSKKEELIKRKIKTKLARRRLLKKKESTDVSKLSKVRKLRKIVSRGSYNPIIRTDLTAKPPYPGKTEMAMEKVTKKEQPVQMASETVKKPKPESKPTMAREAKKKLAMEIVDELTLRGIISEVSKEKEFEELMKKSYASLKQIKESIEDIDKETTVFTGGKLVDLEKIFE